MLSRSLPIIAGATLMAALLGACGAPASASQPAPAPTLPPAPPLSAEAERALAEPAPGVPPAPAALPAPQGAPLLAEDFEAAQLDGWAAEDFSEGPASPASWLPVAGTLAQSGDAFGLPDPGGSYLVAGEQPWRNYRLSAHAFAVQQTSLGLIARKSERGYYRARLEARPEQSLFVLEVVADGQIRELARAEAPAATGRWLRIELSVEGERISAALDGALSISADDTTFSAGRVGLYASADAGARFDNLLVAE